jgi:antitoxin component HigA of HigAB toxin-antitoxin module
MENMTVASGKKAVANRRPRQIASEAALARAIKRIDQLLDHGDSLSKADENELECLSDLVRAYEQKHFPVPAVGNREILSYLLEMKGITLRQLAAATGISYQSWLKIRDGTEEMGAQAMEKTARYFRVNPTVFLPATSSSAGPKKRAASPKVHALLDKSRRQIEESGGIPHEQFWREVKARGDAIKEGKPTGRSDVPGKKHLRS